MPLQILIRVELSVHMVAHHCINGDFLFLWRIFIFSEQCWGPHFSTDLYAKWLI